MIVTVYEGIIYANLRIKIPEQVSISAIGDPTHANKYIPKEWRRTTKTA